eukprot:TRINITY_DN1346_c0_g1_i1.p1 TRINITY_DN1346_c0_g1~~TRINITY_DN1346_c0_g1_i1.p1  ORF type:complete len:703 (+),score=166.52 TRINITY_DN1346_c0_g1_i1:252-2111(+)
MTHAMLTIGQRVIETTVISQDQAEKLAGRTQTAEQPQPGQAPSITEYVPDIFRLPVSAINPGETIRASLVYFQTLYFDSGHYILRVPTELSQNLFFSNMQPSLHISCSINTGTPHCQWGATVHPMVVRSQTASRVELELQQGVLWSQCNSEFIISYFAWSNQITGSLLVEAGENGGRSSMLLFVSPPSPETLPVFARSVVFLIDRSGSMAGTPMQMAKDALNLALGSLKAEDTFNVVAFDDQQEWLSQDLIPADSATIERAKGWVNSIQARGLTDIITPLRTSLSMIGAQTSTRVPFVFLITDGAVTNEREICEMVKSSGTKARVSTFGIGPYCNAYFLKMLAMLGRGFDDVALTGESLFAQMTHLFKMLSVPCLMDLTIGIRALDVEVYPYPLPDLFCGKPIIVSGTFSSAPPPSVLLRGRLSTGAQWEVEVSAATSAFIPVSRVFIKQRLDLLTARAWLTNDSKLKNDVVTLSVAEQMPSAHTRMVGYETTVQKKQEQDSLISKKTVMNAKARGALKAAGVAGLAVGGVIVLGATISSFGNISASLANANIGDAFTALGGGFGDVFSGLGDAVGGVGDAFGSCDCGGGCDGMGDMCGSCGDSMNCCCSVFGALLGIH